MCASVYNYKTAFRNCLLAHIACSNVVAELSSEAFFFAVCRKETGNCDSAKVYMVIYLYFCVFVCGMGMLEVVRACPNCVGVPRHSISGGWRWIRWIVWLVHLNLGGCCCDIVYDFKLPTDCLKDVSHKLWTVLHTKINENSEGYYSRVETNISHMWGCSFRCQ